MSQSAGGESLKSENFDDNTPRGESSESPPLPSEAPQPPRSKRSSPWWRRYLPCFLVPQPASKVMPKTTRSRVEMQPIDELRPHPPTPTKLELVTSHCRVSSPEMHMAPSVSNPSRLGRGSVGKMKHPNYWITFWKIMPWVSGSIRINLIMKLAYQCTALASISCSPSMFGTQAVLLGLILGSDYLILLFALRFYAFNHVLRHAWRETLGITLSMGFFLMDTLAVLLCDPVLWVGTVALRFGRDACSKGRRLRPLTASVKGSLS